MRRHAFTLAANLLVILLGLPSTWAAVPPSGNYCNVPPFVAQVVPPLVLLEMGRDQRMYYTAYNDASDLDSDGRLEIGYDHSIDYYGYFDPYKCYTYSGTGASSDASTSRFSPASVTTNKFCSTSGGQWSGNVLNWLTMSRMDVMRKVLYGGHRSTDTATSGSTSGVTVLERSYIPHETHSWSKEFTGRLCQYTGSDPTQPPYRGMCVVDSDCAANIGYGQCADMSKQLIGISAAPQPTACSASVTASWATSGQAGWNKILWAKYTHSSTMSDQYQCGNDSPSLNISFTPTSFNSFGFASDFNDPNLTPDNPSGYPALQNSNLMMATEFQVTSGKTGTWQFILDSDDGAELLIGVSGTSPTFTNVASTYGCHAACFLPSVNTGTDSNPNNFNYSVNCTGSGNVPNIIVGTYNATATGWYRLVVHQTNEYGNSGVRVWVKRPGDTSWSIFGTTILGSGNLRAPNITTSPDNRCSIQTQDFINTGTPTTGSVTAQRHLFCSTTDTVSGNGSSNTGVTDFVPGPPLLKMIPNSTHRKWEWGAKEATECDWTNAPGVTSANGTTGFQYITRVQVCNSTIGLESNCRKYTDSSSGAVTYKPGGLLQKYGEGVTNDKVCSKQFSKTCTQDSDCTSLTPFGGLCIQRAPMYFGLMTGSFTKNLSGGVLRKDISAITDEYSLNNGVFNFSGTGNAGSASDLPQGNLIRTIDRLRLVGYNYSGDTSGSYNGTPPFGGACNGGNSWLSPFMEGNCRDWGNPIAEIMYEGLRYLSGKAAPVFDSSTSSALDSWISPKQSWGIPASGTTTPSYQPYQIYPGCAKPFALVLSDINPSYDGDQLPGSRFSVITSSGTVAGANAASQVASGASSTYTEDANKPTLGINVGTLLDTIGTNEGINGNNWFVGQTSLTNYDGLCTSKTVSSNFSYLRGLCPEEPSKFGTYYSAAVAYFGKTLLQGAVQSAVNGNQKDANNLSLTPVPNVTTYAVPVASPMPQIGVKLPDGGNIQIIPMARSIDGTWNNGVTTVNAACWSHCKSTSTFDKDGAGGGLVLNLSCDSSAYCAPHTISPIYVEDARYDTNNNLVYGKYMVVFGDSEQGADFDMDARAEYEVCTAAAAAAGYGSCSSDTSLSSNQIDLKVTNPYASAGIYGGIGFVISGTSGNRTSPSSMPNDGTYIVNRQMDKSLDSHSSCPTGSSQPCTVNTLGTAWNKIFTAASTGAAGLLKDPLWYAAKWGGFTDSNNNNMPDLTPEWAKNNGVDPDNYFLVINPLKLETQLDSALTSILARVSSGTASSILNNSEGSGANLLQAVFYPQKTFDSNTTANWIGEIQNLWYYLDPFFNNSTVRVDTNSDYSLDLKSDYIAHFRFDTTQNQTVVDLVQDVNGNGSNLVSVGTYNTDDPNVKSLWRAGKLLWQRNVTSDPRNIYTVFNSTSGTTAAPKTALSLFVNDGSFNANPAVQTLLQAASANEAGAIIDYTRGIDQPSSGYRSRQVTLLNCGLNDAQGCTREWKLGDIINSTPKLESTVRLQSYDLSSPTGYGDSSYASFTASTNYQRRGMVFVGANDGMLHAFKLGLLDVSGQTALHKARLKNLDGTTVSAANNTLGREEWAFVPNNALPYLRYLTDPAYSHLFMVDATSTLVDASINVPSDNDSTAFPNCADASYWNCGKKTVTDSSGNLDLGKSSWRTILVGGMGFGGASQNLGNSCTDNVATGNCVKTPINGVGYSSYFALDVTNPDTLPGQTDPIKFLWEFNGDPANGNYLGYATTGPAIVRIGSPNRNGRWFAVFGSGPTGPIDASSHSFQGVSNQELKLFVVDLATGTLVTTIHTGVSNAFAGSLTSAVIDTDRWNPQSSGFYSDNAIYVGYVQQDTTAGTWTKGGVLRVLTKESTDPTTWAVSTLINGIGPVTTAVTKLQDRNALYGSQGGAVGKLWLYFGSGRYYYKSDALNNQYRLYGIQDPCYSSNTGSPSFSPTGPTNAFDLSGTYASCNTSSASPGTTPSVAEANLLDQSGTATTAPLSSLPSNYLGWYLSLDTSALNDGYSSERVVTNPVASTAGVVFFTTFRPTSDICGYGGNSNIWALSYNSGAAPPSAGMQGKALVQVSTGALAEVSLPTAFSSPGNKRYDQRRTSTAISGMPPSANGLALVSNPKPVKKILHYQEK